MTLREQLTQIINDNIDPAIAADEVMDFYRNLMAVTDDSGPVHCAMSAWTVREFLWRESNDGEPTHEAAMRFAADALSSALEAAEDGVSA